MRAALLVLLALALAAPAEAATRAIPGWPGAPGPSRYDRTTVTTYGPSDARTVLVLVPGTQGGAGGFGLLGPELAERVPGLEVWAWDRRQSALEDASGFRGGARAALRFYLEPILDRSIAPRYRPPATRSMGFARDWGLRTQLEDLRRVVRAARAGGRRVVLGGHSLGASMAAAYASWDFAGRAGWRDLAGLVWLDGGTFGPRSALTDRDARRQLADLARADPFLDLLGAGLPWVSSVFARIAGQAAREDPSGASILRDFPLLPPAFKPPVPATNAGALGFAFDASTSPRSFALVHVRAGALADDGTWADGEATPIARLAQALSGTPDFAEWFFPRRLSLDSGAVASQLRGPTAAGRRLGLRVRHARGVPLPLFAMQTSLGQGRVKAAARRWAQASRIGLRRLTFVDASPVQSHLDPLTAAPDRNTALAPLARWLGQRTG